jgi:transcriptional regulator with XRE-family HTH domain
MSVVLSINEVLKEKGLQQKELAEKLGVSKVTVNYWCNNQSKPSIETLGEIAKILKVKLTHLIKE